MRDPQRTELRRRELFRSGFRYACVAALGVAAYLCARRCSARQGSARCGACPVVAACPAAHRESFPRGK